MSNSPHIVGVCGSLRDDSYTRIALEHALRAVADRGGATELLDLRTYELPVFDPDNPDAGDSEQIRAKIRTADAILLGSPMYHGSYASGIKNALDYCGFDEFEDKTVGLLGVAGGQFPITALEHLRSVCRALNAWVLPHQAAVATASSQFEDGGFVDQEVADRVRSLGRLAVEYARIEPEPAAFESEQNVGAE